MSLDIERLRSKISIGRMRVQPFCVMRRRDHTECQFLFSILDFILCTDRFFVYFFVLCSVV